ncbi:uncharacterized protein IL334_004701 [Kwoniella shivajii]|uniref:C3H1-type domain-containing protein n=1 Tax=Kwoniella shivajii TaxID=564305 RepID=A0ABZ1D2Z6_9TREE|nr:hypothetical protein IL334_004701 [Kwoniella shivajii]
MAIEPTSSAPQVEDKTPIQQLKAEQAASATASTNNDNKSNSNVENGHGNEEQAPNGHVDGLEHQLNGVSMEQGQGQGHAQAQEEVNLHAACAEGRLDDVRSVLSRSLEGLESLDINSGCTPIVLAIRGNHHDVVRELLSAGAIIPPPGLTNDPLMLSILYPQPMYGIPPQFMGMPPQDFYQQPGFFPGPGQSSDHQQHQQQQQRGMFMPPPPLGLRKDSMLNSPNGNGGNNQSNLPPADVSKTIPCRNFPNCKYGASCVFYHPRHQAFFPSGPAPVGPNGNFIPQGYENGYPAPFPQAQSPYFVPSSNQPFSADQQQQSQQPASETPEQLQQQQQNDSQHDQSTIPVQVPQPHGQHVPSAIAPVFVPGFQPPVEMMSPPPPSQFGMSPLSPSMLGTSLPSIPPAEAFFAAASPPNGFMPPLPPAGNNVPAHIRRQSFGQQQQFGMPGKSFGHGKKPSFSGGAKPWMGRPPAANGAAKLGSWKDGVPPACAFFNQGNCRNGEFCKFPHLDAEGNDCRHPDVVRGVIAPMPSFPRQPRGMRMMGGPGFGPVDPAFRQQQHQQQIQFLQQQRMAAAQGQQGHNAAPASNGEPNGNPDSAVAPIDEASAPSAEQNESATAPVETEGFNDTDASNTALPPKPAAAAAAPMPNIIRSASQPGVQRVHANGLNSRSHSPAPSNVSFHGNGHPRRAGSRVPHINGNGTVPNANGSRSSSAGEKKIPSATLQRVPQAHEFPALGTPTSEKKEPSWNGKTAAQVLSAPAPPKPVEVKVTDVDGEGSESGKSDKADSVTMDSDSESDAVIISTKPSSAAQSGAATPAHTSAPTSSASESKKAPISFASALGTASIPSLESAPVALKA